MFERHDDLTGFPIIDKMGRTRAWHHPDTGVLRGTIVLAARRPMEPEVERR